MNKLTFDDAYFLRMKFEKSIQIPKAPLKTPKQTLSPFIALIEYSKPFSPIKNIKEKNQKPSQYQIDTWIIKKQQEVKKSIERQKHIHQQLSSLSKQSKTLKIKSKESWQILHQSKLNRTKEISANDQSLQNSRTNSKIKNVRSKLKKMNSIAQTKNSNNNSILSQEFETLNQSKLDSKFNNLPVLLKSQQNKQMNKSRSGLKFSQKGSEIFKIHEQKGISMTQSYANLKLFEKSRSYSQKAINSRSQISISKNVKQPIKKSSTLKEQQKLKQISTDSSSKSFRLNPIYYDNTKGNRLIKKYDNREMSPIERKDLKNKYSHLQKRLDSILRSVKTQKQNRN